MYSLGKPNTPFYDMASRSASKFSLRKSGLRLEDTPIKIND
jgi:hypothetical protein